MAEGTVAASVDDRATPAEAQQVLDKLVLVWAADDSFVLNQVAAPPRPKFAASTRAAGRA